MSLFFSQAWFWTRMRETAGRGGEAERGAGAHLERESGSYVSLALAAGDEDDKLAPITSLLERGLSSVTPITYSIPLSGWSYCAHFTEEDMDTQRG